MFAEWEPFCLGLNVLRHPKNNDQMNFSQNVFMQENALQIRCKFSMKPLFNSLRPCDTIWHHGSWSTSVQVMACCLMGPSHYLNQCWLDITGVLWHSSGNNFTRIHDDIIKWNIFRVSGPLCREFTGHRRIPLTKASDWSFDVFFGPNKRFSKQLWGWGFEMLSRPLWNHCNGLKISNNKSGWKLHF